MFSWSVFAFITLDLQIEWCCSRLQWRREGRAFHFSEHKVGSTRTGQKRHFRAERDRWYSRRKRGHSWAKETLEASGCRRGIDSMRSPICIILLFPAVRHRHGLAADSCALKCPPICMNRCEWITRARRAKPVESEPSGVIHELLCRERGKVRNPSGGVERNISQVKW